MTSTFIAWAAPSLAQPWDRRKDVAHLVTAKVAGQPPHQSSFVFADKESPSPLRLLANAHLMTERLLFVHSSDCVVNVRVKLPDRVR